MKNLALFLLLANMPVWADLPANPPLSVTETHARMAQDANFHQVSPTLFRSEQLEKSDFPLLQKHNIRTLVNLRFFNRGEDREQFAGSGLDLVNIPLLTWSISPDEVAQALYAIERGERNGAVLVHCYHGADRTGLIVGMYRIIVQGWPIADAERELREGGYGFHAIWQNIPNYFEDQRVNEVRRELEKLRAAERPARAQRHSDDISVQRQTH